MYKHVFGPVPSRRLGISLGVDLVKPKSCNMNCVFCECGATPKLADKRESFKDIKEVESEIKSVLKDVKPDYITFSGSGEPTLSKDLGEIINWIKDNTDANVCLITNSLLLNDDEVINEVLRADLIIPTLNSVDDEIFHKINRPSKDIHISMVMSGLQKLSAVYNGKIYLETFIIEGLNDGEEHIKKMAEFLKTIKFTKIQLNSLARKGAERWVKPASIKVLNSVKKIFIENGINNVEIVKELSERKEKIEMEEDLIENMKSIREYSEEEMKKIFKIKNTEKH
ncbi:MULTISPECIES: radical SAM protein [Fusobacterium]|jgi:wyosine [tRNA(Phe)-imidazoG37] synthetase (radical SAM superfamily)|uniref:radical SAM protein n=1 Tax=Fusobacterium TaxID=848 RepID=UPI0008A6424C|nr:MULTISPECIES: radical SAM protein [Fusobacterium]MCF0171080.1 radical SAM protein [Fusobacterium varium]MCF2674111.1 radical SAM protein [Fusobacterium varium]MCI6031803.1 radical SAM protein [Fusobacterium varium]OFL92439.1 radical SAM protein [Fusobacterium sp. HMSC073F01]RGJ24278.1 radical SAM protein [Fusobacterium varium]